MSGSNHDCKVHSEAKRKYFFSFESPVKVCGHKAWNSIMLPVTGKELLQFSKPGSSFLKNCFHRGIISVQ